MKIGFSTRRFRILTIKFQPKLLLVCQNHTEKMKVQFNSNREQSYYHVSGIARCSISYRLTIVTYYLSRFIPSIGFYELLIICKYLPKILFFINKKKIILLAFYQLLWEIIVIHISSKHY